MKMKLFVLALISSIMSVSAQVFLQSTFAQSDEGWTVVDANENTMSVSYANTAVSYVDSGSGLWWFSSPSTFQGDLTAAYNGQLTFALNFLSYNDNGQNAIVGADIVLVAGCGYSLSKKGVVTAGSTNTYTLVLNEDGWIDSRTQSAPNVYDFLGVLNNIASIRIRGAYFAGQETTQLSSVTIQKGTQWFPCCTIGNDIDICSRVPSPFFNPSNLKFYCEGSQKKLITISNIKPQFGRRSGGTLITVTGQYFGFAGSTATVRVNGVACQKSFHTTAAGSQVIGVKGPVQETALYCYTPPGEGSSLSVTVEAASGPTDSPYNVRMPSNRKGWQSFETTAVSCVSEVNRAFSYGGHDWAWATTIEQGADSGSVSNVAVDNNSGNIYIAGYILGSASPGIRVQRGNAPVQEQKYISCKNVGSTQTRCGYILQLNPSGKLLWFDTIEPSGAVVYTTAITSISVDSSSTNSKPMIYFTGYSSGAGSATLKMSIFTSGGGLTFSSPAVLGTGTTVFNFVGQVNGDGTGQWLRLLYRCTTAQTTLAMCDALGHQVTTESFSTRPLIATYRASTSSIMNQHTKGDAPSNDYILGVPRDNGGVYVATTLYPGASPLASGWTPAGELNGAYAAAPAIAQYAYIRPMSTSLVHVLIKYDNAGNAHWLRELGLNTVSAPTNKITALVATNDAVFVSHMAGLSTGTEAFYDNCEFSTLTSGLGSANSICRTADPTAGVAATAAQYTLSSIGAFAGGTVRTISFLGAYSAAGKLKWSKEIIPSSFATSTTQFDLEVTSMAFVRPRNGDQPINTSPFQPSVSSFANGFYLYLGANYRFLTWPSAQFFSKALQFPPSGTSNYRVALFKLDASTGNAIWNSYWGNGANDLKIQSVKVDERTGAVYFAGAGQAGTGQGACNGAPSNTNCGTDHFGFGTRVASGCNEDPRSQTGAAVGQPYCAFVPYNAAIDTGYIAKVTDAVLDNNNNVLSNVPADDTSSKPSIVWFKTFGLSTTATAASTISSLEISDNNILALGTLSAAGSYTFPNIQTAPGAPATFSGSTDILTKLTD